MHFSDLANECKTKSPAQSAGGLNLTLELVRDDLYPVCSLAGRIFPDLLERTALPVDGVGRDRVRLLARTDHELAGRIDREAARLLLGRRAADKGKFPGRT